MKCFQHTRNDAIAICCACGRAVCRECELDAEGDAILCSSECHKSYEKTEIARTAILELTLASARSFRGLVIVFRILAALFFLAAIGELSQTFLLVQFIPGIQPLHPVVSCGVAAVLIVLGIVCAIATKSVAPIAKRYDELVRRMSDESA